MVGGAGRHTAVRTLAIDRAAAELFSALRSEGVDALLLKGPVLARRLYDDGHVRGYGDVDVLVGPAHLDDARAVLARLGYAWPSAQALRDEDPHGVQCRRAADGAHVDLHHTLPGPAAPAAAVWDALWARRAPLTLFGTEVATLDDAGLAFHAALHAAQHGERVGRPLADLSRALGRIDAAAWSHARDLAELVGALEPFAAGLRLVAAGEEVAARLALDERLSPRTALAAGTAPETAWGWLSLVEASGLRARVRILSRELAPTPGYVREWAPFARRGRIALALAYAARPLWLLGRAVPALAAVRRARAAARDSIRHSSKIR